MAVAAPRALRPGRGARRAEPAVLSGVRRDCVKRICKVCGSWIVERILWGRRGRVKFIHKVLVLLPLPLLLLLLLLL